MGLKPQTRSINRILPVLAVLFLLIQFDVLPVYLTLCFLPLVVFVTAFDRGRVADILKKEPFQWLGERSYSVYLWHWPCMMGMHAVLHSHVPAVIYYVAVIAVVLGISELSYRYFECPLRDFIKNSASNKKLVKPQIGAILPSQRRHLHLKHRCRPRLTSPGLDTALAYPRLGVEADAGGSMKTKLACRRKFT